LGAITSNSGIHIYLSDLNKNIGGLTDLSKKRHGLPDLHTPIGPSRESKQTAANFSNFHFELNAGVTYQKDFKIV